MASALPSALLRDAGRSRSVGARRAPLPPGTRMSELSQHEFSGRASSLTREGPEVMQAFVVRHRPFFILVAVLFAQLLLLSFQITRNRNVRLIQVWAVDVFSPFERALHWVGSGFEGAWKSVTSLRSTEKENLELRAERDRLQASVNALTEKAAAADRLRALLEFKKEVSYSTVAAEVIAASPGEHSATVSIGKGRDAGLTGDLAVITPLNNVIDHLGGHLRGAADYRPFKRRRLHPGKIASPRGAQGQFLEPRRTPLRHERDGGGSGRSGPHFRPRPNLS